MSAGTATPQTAADTAQPPPPNVQVINASGADAATLIEKLARVRDHGVISDQQVALAKEQVGADRIPSSIAGSKSVAQRLNELDELRPQGMVNDWSTRRSASAFSMPSSSSARAPSNGTADHFAQRKRHVR